MDDQLKTLAETLKKTGMAASMYEAIEKAKSIMNIKPQIDDPNTATIKTPENREPGVNANIDVDLKNKNTSLNELMKEVKVTPEQVEEKKQEKIEEINEEISEIKGDISLAENNPEKIEDVKDELEKVKEDVNKIEEIKSEKETINDNSQSDNDTFKEEKKIDLTKIFGNKN